MVALVKLTPEETGLVLHGSLYDPTYRPMDIYDGDEFGEDDQEDDYGANAGASAKHRISSLEKTVAAAYWRKHNVDVALLLAERDQPGNHRLSDRMHIIALARAEAPHRRGSGRTGVRYLTLSEWQLLPEPLSFERLVDQLPAWAATKIAQIARTRTRPLPPATATALTELLRGEIERYDSLAGRLSERRSPLARPVSDDSSMLELRDASITALWLFDDKWRSLQPSQDPADPPAALDRLVADATENDLITDDVDVFPGWNRHRSQRGWVEFRSRGRRLLVKNINFSRAEVTTGADLVYWRSEPDAFVIVQYKKLVSTKEGHVYRFDNRLSKQIDQMLATTRVDPAERPLTPDDYRLSAACAFVKFTKPLSRHADDELIPGYYLPADLVQLIMQNPDLGPRGGKILRIPEARTLNSEMFVRLVRDCWVGTTRKASDTIHDLLPGLRADPPAHLIIAYDEPAL